MKLLTRAAIQCGGLILLLTICLFLGCSRKTSHNNHFAATSAIFAPIDNDHYLVVLTPHLMSRLFGEQWYLQQIFVDHSHNFMGQPGPPWLIWKGDGLAFDTFKYPEIDGKVRPYWITLYSLDKKSCYVLHIRPEKAEVSIASVMHGPAHEERVSNGLLLEGFQVQP